MQPAPNQTAAEGQATSYSGNLGYCQDLAAAVPLTWHKP